MGRAAIVAALSAMVIGVLLVAARTVTLSNAPKLIWGGGWMNAGYGSAVTGVPYTYGDLNPCVNKGSVTVLKITPTRSAGITLDGWGSRPNPFDHGVTHIGAEDGGNKVATVTEAGFHVGPRRVVNLCTDRSTTRDKYPNDFEFAVELRRTGAATGWAYGLTVTYRSGGGTHTAQWPMGYVLCGNTSPTYPTKTMDGLCNVH